MKCARLLAALFDWVPFLSKNEIFLYLFVLKLTYRRRARKRSVQLRQAQIASALSLSRSTVQRLVYKLEKHGLLIITRRHRYPSLYEIAPPTPAPKPLGPQKRVR